MNLLILVVVSIIVYAEILPTVDLLFDYIRSWIAYGIVLVQTKAEEVQQPEEQNESTHAIGFYTAEPESEFDDGDEEDE